MIIKRILDLKYRITQILTIYTRIIIRLLRLKTNSFQQKTLHQYFPEKPEVINLNATDICNSGCKMCNIWTREKEFEFSPSELKSILSDKLFSEVKHVGITGGEPTLRDDLVDLYESVITTLPKLQGVSIITNSIDNNRVYTQIKKIENLCKSFQMPFSVMVSLDGLGEVHDKNRGKKGNFQSSISLISKLKSKTDIPISIGCTITKYNVWEVDDLLFFLKQNEIYGRFRVAEFINRLYNQNNKNAIRSFTDDERYHLQLFFFKLQYAFETNPTNNRTYNNIVEMLEGENRKIGCPYHSRGIVLNSKGELSYCAPKSKIIGNALKKSAHDIFTKNLKERRRILQQDCKQCIHDYHAPITYKEELSALKEQLSRYITRYHFGKFLKFYTWLSHKKKSNKGRYTIFIIGWYGTETIGDKAILGGIISSYKERIGDGLNIVIGSIYPFITKRTIKELNIDAKVVNSRSLDLLKYSAISDETIMGGGPLMDLDELFIPYTAFYSASFNKNKTTIYGCGLGPLKQDKNIELVKKIFKLSTDIFLRDEDSRRTAIAWTNRSDIKNIEDPAKSFVETIGENTKSSPKSELACFLREWTHEYAQELSKSEFYEKRKKLEKGIANKIKNLAKEKKVATIKLYHMHNFHIGYDDRDFSRRFIHENFPNDNSISFHKELSSVDNIILAMKSAKLNLCMRFHSVLFAHTINADFYAIDYTQGGKIKGFLNDNNALNKIISIQDLLNEDTVS